MNMALRWKITVAFTLLAAVVFLLLDLSLQVMVSRNGIELMQQRLQSEMALAQLSLPPVPWRPTLSLQQEVSRLDRLTGARVTLISPSGLVLADSREAPARMENHSDRPEVRQAVSEGAGSALRHSATTDVDMLYVALAVPQRGIADRSVLRLSQPMTQVRATSSRLRQAIWVGFAIAVALAWLASLLLSSSLTAPIQTLVRVARRVDQGDLTARIEGVEGQELGEFASVFNSAVASLAEALEKSRREGRHWAAILEQMSDALIVVDSSGRIEFINPTFARLFGLEMEGVRGRASEGIALNYELSALLQRAVAQNAVQRDEVRLLYPEPRIVAAVVSPFCEEHGDVVGAIGLIRDVTDLQRMEEVRREFVANASHELRTPAAAVKALAEALQMGALKDRERGPRFVQQIVEAADRQTSLLDDMLTLTRVERGSELLEIRPLDVAEAFEAAARQIRPAAEAKGVTLDVEVTSAESVTADASGLHTILLNLLDNAVKYTRSGGQVTMRGARVPGGYEISVTDTGIGISQPDQLRIFERFYRVDRARDRATGGTGLGLSIVKHLTEAHGGRATVRSAPGLGSTFSVFLPVPRATAPPIS